MMNPKHSRSRRRLRDEIDPTIDGKPAPSRSDYPRYGRTRQRTKISMPASHTKADISYAIRMMIRCVAVATPVIFLGSCTNDINGLPFVDTFDRAATKHGLGSDWDMRGAYAGKFPLPPASDGFISGGSFTYSGKDVVYGTRRLNSTVRQISAEGRWREIGVGGETTLAMAISENDRFVTDMVHFTASRAAWKLTLRQGGGDFQPIASGQFSPALQIGQQYEFSLEVGPSSVTVRVPGNEVIEKASAEHLLGPYVFWEEYPSPAPAGVVFDFSAVSAS